FLPRARVLQARTAVQGLRELAVRLHDIDPAAATRLDREVEQIEASTVDFARLRAAHLVASAAVSFADAERAELERLLLGSSPAAALGLPPAASPDAVRDAALAAITRWRTRAGDPLANPAFVEVCETAARTCESFYAAAVATPVRDT